MDIAFTTYITALVAWIISMLLLLRLHLTCKAISNHKYPPADDNQLPPLTVIVTTCNQEHELRQHLPLILNQVYPRFEVIVVDVNSTDGTKKVLEQFEADNIMLRHTFTPATGRDISKQRLAITLGVKASSYDWFVVTDATCCPLSHLWLHRIGECVVGHRSAEIILGYTRYKTVSNYVSRRLCFYTLWRQLLNFSLLLNKQKNVVAISSNPKKLLKTSGAYCADATNLAYKKQLFLSHHGFASGSNLHEGATEIMVNQNSTSYNTALCLQSDAIMEQETPTTANYWNNKRLFFQETQRHFTHKKSFLLNNLLILLSHTIMSLCLLTTIVVSLIFSHYVISAVAFMLWLTHFSIQGLLINNISRCLNGRPFSLFTTAWFTHLLPFWGLSAWLRHCFANKSQFRKKYI